MRRSAKSSSVSLYDAQLLRYTQKIIIVKNIAESEIEIRFALRRTVSEIQGKTDLDMDIWTNVTYGLAGKAGPNAEP